MKRRSFVKGTLSAGATSLAVGAGILSPAMLLAEDTAKKEAATAAPAAADEAKATEEAASTTGFDMATIESAEKSDAIKLKAPSVAENGAVVPVTVDASSIEGATKITLVAPNNPDPLVATFELAEGTVAYAATRIKMGKSGSVVALVTAGDKTLKAETEVKVTIGGCGG